MPYYEKISFGGEPSASRMACAFLYYVVLFSRLGGRPVISEIPGRNFPDGFSKLICNGGPSGYLGDSRTEFPGRLLQALDRLGPFNGVSSPPAFGDSRTDFPGRLLQALDRLGPFNGALPLAAQGEPRRAENPNMVN